MSTVPFDQFASLDIKIGKIISAEQVEGADRLVKLVVDVGEEAPRQIIAGIAPFVADIGGLVGKHCPFVVNLEPKMLKGLESQGMLLAVSTPDGGFSLLVPETVVPAGSKIR